MFSWIKRAVVAAVAVVVGGAFLAGMTIRPYDRPEYHEVDTSESAFLIPLEGDTGEQSVFPSLEFLEERKVALKRVRIPHRWNQLGFMPRTGEWLPVVRLVKVDRRPITREWTQSHSSGTSAKDEAISVESRDSVNLTMGIGCTAQIPEELAATFLYSYPSKSLAEMMDMEVRARIQQVAAEEAARYDLDVLRSKKNEIMQAVRADVTPHFEKRGIRLTTIGLLGGLVYENKEIQKAIDDSVKAQQLKVSAEAKREAQEVENRTLKLAAEGKADAAVLAAKGEASAEMLRAEAEAKRREVNATAEAAAIRQLAEARVFEAEQAHTRADTYVRIKEIEAEANRWKQWDGKYPAYWMQFGQTESLMGFRLPPVPAPVNGKTAKATE